MVIEPPNIVSSNTMAFFTTKIFNINELSRRFNISGESLYLPIQKHTDRVYVLESDLKPIIADAVLTAKKAVLIGVRVADCVPMLLYDKENSVIGAVHGGWRGTAKEILKNTIKAMKERFNSSANDILIAIGPSIRGCCYMVGDEVKDAVYKATGEGDYYHMQDGKYVIDLASANKIQALSMGIPKRNIWQSQECTFCNPDKFHSYRYTGGSTGRQAGFIGMRNTDDHK